METDEVTRIVRFGESILMEEIELLEGVADSLDVLSKRHHLVMFTKGNEAEQRSKIERSGVEHHFRSTRIVPEKDRDAYRSLLSELDVDPRSTWMIGNSPKSDINPALAEGMNAVFIPHEHTWRLELQRLESGGGYFLQLAAFSELLSHF
jgi:putative hydrolase of the HAD superfamily